MFWNGRSEALDVAFMTDDTLSPDELVALTDKLYDDRAVQVKANEGELVGKSTRGL